MCGIAGIIGAGNKNTVVAMSNAIAHRGPDDQGIKWIEEDQVGFGHRRLSIIDLSPLGHQPMCDKSERYWIIFNGEIYNYLDVKRELESKGYSFSSRSDTEVILAAYDLWKERCLEKLNGMFALALWDTQEKIFFAARDRLGKKPFYYYHKNSAFLFASEIKGILASGIPERKINEEALYLYLSLQYVPGPKTLFAGIHKLQPGHYLRMQNNDLTIHQYWKAPYGEVMEDKGIDVHAEEFRDIVKDAVKIRMISDVPLGAFLSGGLDSSVVVGYMAQMSTERVKTYSVGFVEGGKHYDELEFAKIVSDKYNTVHHEVICNSEEAKQRIPELIYYLDEPVCETLIYPINKLSRLTKQTATVALTGEGPDEFLHGYRYYSVLHQYMGTFSKLPEAVRNSAFALLNRRDILENSKLRILGALLKGNAFEQTIQWSTMFPHNAIERLMGKSLPYSVASAWHDSTDETLEPTSVTSYLEHKYRMVDYIFMRTDKMSMETGLECRSPFLDYRAVEYMVRTPLKYKNPGGESKYLLRKAFTDVLPSEIQTRKKKPFAAPIHAWLYDLSAQYLKDSELVRNNVLDREEVSRYMTFQGERSTQSIKLWLLVMLEIWYRNYFVEKRI